MSQIRIWGRWWKAFRCLTVVACVVKMGVATTYRKNFNHGSGFAGFAFPFAGGGTARSSRCQAG